jgi:hypothetical protein
MRFIDLRKRAEIDRPNLKNDLGKYDEEVEVSFKIKGDGKRSIVEMLDYIAGIGSVGHSFEIVVDPESSEYRETFGFDGDGADRIDDIKIDGKKAEFK